MFRCQSLLIPLLLAIGCSSSNSTPDPAPGSNAGSGGSSSEVDGSSTTAGSSSLMPDGSPSTVDSSAAMSGDSAMSSTDSAQGDAASNGAFTASAVDGCKYSYTPVSYCMGTPKPQHWECDPNPGNMPPWAGCEHPANSEPTSVNWCCAEPFCSHYAGGDGLCAGFHPTQPHGYICAPKASGIEQCSAPITGAVYCCP